MQPSDSQRFTLCLFLLHRRGVTSFDDLKTVDGLLCDTFRYGTRAMGLIEDDAEDQRCQ